MRRSIIAESEKPVTGYNRVLNGQKRQRQHKHAHAQEAAVSDLCPGLPGVDKKYLMDAGELLVSRSPRKYLIGGLELR